VEISRVTRQFRLTPGNRLRRLPGSLACPGPAREDPGLRPAVRAVPDRIRPIGRVWLARA
jgi:hypothetical protein